MADTPALAAISFNLTLLLAMAASGNDRPAAS